MSDNTKIEWADATVNAINGCSVVSPGCTNCYAMRWAGTRLRHHPSRAGLTIDSKAGPVWNGKVRLNEEQLIQPLRWKRPRRIFWNAHGDTFHHAVPDEWIDRIFAICALTPQHTHMILTKRSARMREYITVQSGDWSRADAIWTQIYAFLEQGASWDNEREMEWPLPNVWLGVSAEDQTRADERIPELLATPAAVRFISAEPLLGPIDLTHIDCGEQDGVHLFVDALDGLHSDGEDTITGIYSQPDARVHWVIAGGESGPGARPMHPNWARSLRDQCAAAGVAFHFKQWGDWAPLDIARPVEPGSPAMAAWKDGTVRPGTSVPADFDGGIAMYRATKRIAGRLLDGRTHDEWPA